MMKEPHQLATGLSETGAQSPSTAADSAIDHVDTTLLVLSLRHATVKIESGPLFTKLTVNSRFYYFDHITGRLLQEGVV